MIIKISNIFGLTLASLIIAYLGVWSREKKGKFSEQEKLNICVFTFWAAAILLDVMFNEGYTFTVIKGLKLHLG